MQVELVINQLQSLKEEALNSKMDDFTATRKIKQAIALVSPLSQFFEKRPSDATNLSFVSEFESFLNNTNSTVDKIVNRTSDLLYFCNTVFRIINTHIKANRIN